MLNTRLIMFEGLAGSGKTSTVTHLGRLLTRRSHAVRTVCEEDDCRPRVDEFPNFVTDFPYRMTREWLLFRDEIMGEDALCLLEGHGWQPMAEYMFMAGYSRRDVIEFCDETAAILSPLRPIVVYYAHNDVAGHVEWLAATRGRDWIRLVEERDSTYHGLNRFQGSLLRFWCEWSDIQEEIFSRWPFAKLRITNPRRDWCDTYGRVRAFLGV